MPLPPKAREARALPLREARWLVEIARKDAALTDLAALCRDRRKDVQRAAGYALINFLLHEVDRDRLIGWYNHRMTTRRPNGRICVGSDDVETDLAAEYATARGRFVVLLAAAGVPDPGDVWCRRAHAFRCGAVGRASALADAAKSIRPDSRRLPAANAETLETPCGT